jgi:hypothetical protein
MAHAKIALPFNQACKLSDEQKCKLIICQARRVAIQEWEIESLLWICKSKGWIDKGLAVLYEYAGYIDDMKSIMDMRHDLCSSFLSEVASQCETDDDNLSTLRQTATITAKAVYILCCWRRLQWFPRPVYFEDSVQDEQQSFHNIIRDDATKIYNALVQNANLRDLVECQSLSVEQLVILVAPARGLEYRDLEDLLLGSEKDSVNQGDDSRESSPQQHALQLTPQHHALFIEIHDVFSLEDRVETAWRLIHSTLDDNCEPIDVFPALRLPYKDYRPPTDALIWFNESMAQYNTLGSSLAGMARAAQPHSPKTSNAFTNNRPFMQLIETAPVVYSGRKLADESVSSKLKKRSSPRNRRGQPRTYSNEDDELRQITSSMADSEESRPNNAYDESPAGSPTGSSSAMDIDETRSRSDASPMGSQQEARRLQKQGSAGSKISTSKSATQLPKTVMSSPAGSTVSL